MLVNKVRFHRIGSVFQAYLYFRVKKEFFLAQVSCWHFTVNHSFLMILDSQKTLDQRGFNAPKIIQIDFVSSELCSLKEHHVQFFSEVEIIKIYDVHLYRDSY